MFSAKITLLPQALRKIIIYALDSFKHVHNSPFFPKQNGAIFIFFTALSLPKHFAPVVKWRHRIYYKNIFRPEIIELGFRWGVGR